jgi:hypothetical protein
MIPLIIDSIGSGDFLTATASTILVTLGAFTVNQLKQVAETVSTNTEILRGYNENERWDGLIELASQNAERIEQHQERLEAHERRLEEVERIERKEDR